jgi:predicted transcriptional regulator
MLMTKTKKYFDDYTKFRSILLNHNIKDLNGFAKLMGLGAAAVSERFSGKRSWKLKELNFMSKKFKLTLDEVVLLLELED